MQKAIEESQARNLQVQQILDVLPSEERPRYGICMIRLKALVRGGRLVMDEPTDLPEGAEVELIAADSWDDLDDADRELLHASLEASEEDVRAGRIVAAAEVLSRLRRPAS